MWVGEKFSVGHEHLPENILLTFIPLKSVETLFESSKMTVVRLPLSSLFQILRLLMRVKNSNNIQLSSWRDCGSESG